MITLTVKQTTMLSISTLALGLTLGWTIAAGSSFRNGFDKGYTEGLNASSKGYKLLSVSDCNIKITSDGVFEITARKDSTKK